jgi:hypothetical protein
LPLFHQFKVPILFIGRAPISQRENRFTTHISALFFFLPPRTSLFAVFATNKQHTLRLPRKVCSTLPVVFRAFRASFGPKTDPPLKHNHFSASFSDDVGRCCLAVCHHHRLLHPFHGLLLPHPAATTGSSSRLSLASLCALKVSMSACVNSELS